MILPATIPYGKNRKKRAPFDDALAGAIDDPATVLILQLLASHWGVSLVEAARRAICHEAERVGIQALARGGGE